MAADDANNWSETMDRPEHEKTFDLFMGLVKYGTAICILILVLMAIFLV